MQIRSLNVLNRQRKLSGHNSCINLEKEDRDSKDTVIGYPPPKKEKKNTTKKSLKLQAQGYVPFWSIV